jgi:hypothetical protein
MKKLLLCLSLLITLTVSAQQVPKGLTASNGQFIGFYQYTPTTYDANPNTKYPLIIFLHGVSEKGNGTTELPLIEAQGPLGNIKNGHTMTFTWNGKTETFLVLAPQLSKSYGGWQNWYVEEMINYAKKNLRIDENRIFLTGLSLGGGGVWSYAGATLDNAKTLAGIGISCGTCPGINFSNLTNANLPIWAFHAADDLTVLPICTISAIDNINKLNPAVVPYKTIWPTGDHWIWGRVYDTEYRWQNPNLYEWFLGQNKSLPVNKRPVANAGSAIGILNTTGTVTLNASKSTDADGKIVRYVWTKIAGPYSGTLLTNSYGPNSTTTVNNLELPGTYKYELKVVDDRADWALDTVTVTVSLATPPPASNKPPTVNAGADISVNVPVRIVKLKGISNDPDGYILSHEWTKISGPTTFEIINPNYAETEVMGLVPGTYVFRLTVIDAKLAVASDDITVVVNGSGPNPGDGSGSGVNPGPDVTITLPTNSVALDGSQSSDPYGGNINAWKWAKISGPSSFAITNSGVAVTTATNLVEGTYEFQLTTWNSAWVPKSAIKVVTVKAGSTPPQKPSVQVANAGADVTITLPTNSAPLNGSASANPNGVINGYSWSKISGPTAFTIANAQIASTTVSGLTEGTYEFKLTTLDHLNAASFDTMKVIVKAAVAPKPPPSGRVANAGADITITLPINSVTLDGSGSVNPLGPIYAWTWNQISGPAATIANAKVATTTASNLAAGTYQFRLTVWDHQFVPSSDTMIVIVKPGVTNPGNGNNNGGGTTGPSGNGTITNAGPDQTLYLPNNSTTLTGAASNDPAGNFWAWTWTKISGPDQHTIANNKLQVTTVSNLVEGTYRFRLTGWGNDWRPFSDTMQITVVSNAARIVTTATTNAVIASSTAEARVGITESKLLLYPNPAQGQLHVQTSSTTTGASFLNIYDMAGKLILKTGFQKMQPLHQQIINVSSLKPGVYHAEVIIDNGVRLNSKFIKQ